MLRQARGRPASWAVGGNPLDMEHQCIAGLRAPNEVIGLGLGVMISPEESLPEASTVVVITRSPGSIVSTGGCEPMVLK
jgi:hypothetical protein